MLRNRWKITLKLDPKKQAQEVILSQKLKNTLHSPLNSSTEISKTLGRLSGW